MFETILALALATSGGDAVGCGCNQARSSCSAARVSACSTSVTVVRTTTVVSACSAASSCSSASACSGGLFARHRARVAERRAARHGGDTIILLPAQLPAQAPVPTPYETPKKK